MTEKIGIEIKLLHENAKIPEKAKKGDNCYDLTAVSKTYNDEYGFWEYDTGIAIKPQEGYATQIYPRSSISKYDIFLANSVGEIDNGFENTLKLRFKPTKFNFPKTYNINDKIGQLKVFKQYEIDFTVVEEFSSSSERGQDGFGSSGE